MRGQGEPVIVRRHSLLVGGVNKHQQTALDWHCRLAVETMHPRFARRLSSGLSVVLTVNSGYE